MMRIIILCAGKQTRFSETAPPGTGPKQLLPIGDIPILHRTIAMARPFDTPVVVTRNHELKATALARQAIPYEPTEHTRIADTLASTRSIWRKRTIVLLGDVYYGRRCLPFLLSTNDPLTFFGNTDEIFALSFTPHIALDEAIAKARTSREGKLWHIYRAYEGISLDTHTIHTNPTFHVVTDETDDVDTWQEYQSLRRKLNE